MPNPHFDISITQRSQGKSAVAGAAYQSGEKLFSEYDQKMKDYTRKRGIVYTEIMLPANAPPEYADRQVLWNSAEEVEKQWNSQLARRFVLITIAESKKNSYTSDMTTEDLLEGVKAVDKRDGEYISKRSAAGALSADGSGILHGAFCFQGDVL